MELELAKVSENWGDAFAKQLGRINNELEAFRDTLAGSVIEFFQSSGRGILNEILFGQKGEDITDKINDLRFQLLQVQGEKAGIQIIEDQEASLLSRINLQLKTGWHSNQPLTIHMNLYYFFNSPIRFAISIAVTAASKPLFPAFVPALSIACSMVSVVRTPNITGTSVSRETCAIPFVTSLET